MNLKIPVKFESIKIGKSTSDFTELTAIEYVRERLEGSGPGGDMVSPQTVLNKTQLTGVLHHHKWKKIMVGLNEDEYQALFSQPVYLSAPAIRLESFNPPISYLSLTKQFSDGTTQTKNYGNWRVKTIRPTNLRTEEGKYIVEVEFVGDPFYLAMNLKVYRYVEEFPEWPDLESFFSNMVFSETITFNAPMFSNVVFSETPIFNEVA